MTTSVLVAGLRLAGELVLLAGTVVTMQVSQHLIQQGNSMLSKFESTYHGNNIFLNCLFFGA